MCRGMTWLYVCFFFNDTATTEIYTLSLHDALPISDDIYSSLREVFTVNGTWYCPPKDFSTLGLIYDQIGRAHV